MLLGVGGIALIISALQQFNSVSEPVNDSLVPTVLSATLDSGSTSTTDTSLGEEPSLSEEPKDLATSTSSPVPALTFTSTPASTATPLSDQLASGTKTLEFTDNLFFRAGGGIVADSIPENETLETEAKANGMLILPSDLALED